MHRKNLLSIAMLIAAAATPFSAFASDQPGAAASQWKEELTNNEFKPDNVTLSNGNPDSGRFITNFNATPRRRPA